MARKETITTVKLIKENKDVSKIIPFEKQLLTFATLIDQICDKIELDTPEYHQAKNQWNKIKTILGD